MVVCDAYLLLLWDARPSSEPPLHELDEVHSLALLVRVLDQVAAVAADVEAAKESQVAVALPPHCPQVRYQTWDTVCHPWLWNAG